MLIKYDCYGVYRMNGIFRGDLIGVYDVVNPTQALDECIQELGLAEDSYDYAKQKMIKDERYKDNMDDYEFDRLLDDMFDEIDSEFWVKPMVCR